MTGFARVLRSIWSDPDFVGLNAAPALPDPHTDKERHMNPQPARTTYWAIAALEHSSTDTTTRDECRAALDELDELRAASARRMIEDGDV